MAVRLSKIAREFNVGLSTIVEFLHSKGIKISSDPNAKLTDEDYALVAKEFSSDSQVKKESSLVDLKNTRKKKETVTIDNAGNISSGNENTEEEEGSSSKLAVALVTLVIIIVWLAILALLIKWDVGGFGSTVMRPLLKDIPYVNRILPDSEDDLSTEEDYPYKNMDEAVAYIKELEQELAQAQQGSSENSAYIADLEAQSQKLKEYEANEAAFEEEKEKFYNEVVFSDQAPDIEQYKEYYESIDPDNAELLYKQVVEQQQTDSKISDYVKGYSQMKPKEAAAIFDTMTDNLNLVAQILENMDAQSRADILGKMNSDTAAKVTEIMNPSE